MDPRFARTEPDDETKAALLNIASRQLTLEGRMSELEDAMKKWAAMMNSGITATPRVAQDAPVSIRPPSPQEEAAYCAINYARLQANEPQFNGIQDWRDQGSPTVAKAAE